ncbi:MAG: glucosaminidase domain-containing protein, partial [Coriobacteriales bacterium]|nr:glucosaminidase domain-containing protein [Coriobacteriales bacterium]
KDADNQKFLVIPKGSGYYVLRSLGSGKALDINSKVMDDATGAGDVIQWSETGGTNQLWRFEYAPGTGGVRIYSAMNAGQSCLTVESPSLVAGNEVDVLNASSSLVARQSFKPVRLGNVSYENLNMTMAQMIDWQFAGNSYLTGWGQTPETLKVRVDPAQQTGSYYYQFTDLRLSDGTTAAELEAFINSTSTGRSGNMVGMGATFLAAANYYGLNPTYLLAHAIHESGWGTSTLAKGYAYDGKTEVGGKTWPAGTYYNYFGIGAVDSSPLTGGRAMAIKEGWNSREAAIWGAAKWIAANYTYRSSYPQPTLYAMKWDYARSSATLKFGSHQYATGYEWARSIAKLMGQCYSYNGRSPSLYYIVPVYK